MIVGYSRVNSMDKEKYEYFFSWYEQLWRMKFDEIELEVLNMSRDVWEKRNLWRFITDMAVTKIVVPDLSRIGKNPTEALYMLKNIKKSRPDLKIYIAQNNITYSGHMSEDDKTTLDVQLALLNRTVENHGDRTKEGIKKAQKAGKHIGRPFGSSIKFSKKQIRQVRSLLMRGESKSTVATHLGISRQKLYQLIHEEDSLKQFIQSR